MSWSWRLGRLAGIPIEMHWTFLVLIVWLVIGHTVEGHDVATTLAGVGFVMALFGCVVLHELGHALAARRYGVTTTKITLLPIGGVAQLGRIPEKPVQELIIALAGPAVNAVIVAGLWIGGVRLTGGGDPRFLIQGAFLPRIMVANAFLGLFNLIPAFPMDGGRVLRALLALRYDYVQATATAATVGQMSAIGFGLLGLSVGNPFLLFIAIFVWIAAGAEAAQVQERRLMHGARARDAMLTDYQTLRPFDTLERAADALVAGTQHDFPVEADDGRFVGLLTREALVGGLSRSGGEARIADFMTEKPLAIAADAPLATAIERLRDRQERCLEVVDQGKRVGIIDLENVGEFVMIRAALATGFEPRTSPRPDNAKPLPLAS